MRRLLRALLLLGVGLAAVMAVRTARLLPTDVAVEPVERMGVAAETMAERLAEAVRIPTVAYEDVQQVDAAAFQGFQTFLAETWPALHRRLERERVGRAGLLFRWAGSNPALAPVVLMAHYDVVPVQPGTEDDWEHPPFAGTVADGWVWGRGALDDKGSLVALCEAVDRLAREGFRPARTLYLAFGHDEEVGGGDGARRTAELLAARGVAPELVLDEGGALALPGVVPGVSRTIALVGIAEKGYLSLELRVTSKGGHSSRPPPQSGVGILASAIHRLERDQMPRGLGDASRGLLLAVGSAGDLPMRVALANLWLTEPLVIRRLGRSPLGNALVRTTTAATMFEGSPKDNVLPIRARAVVNFRILPGDTMEGVIAHVRRSIDDDRIEVAQHGAFASEPSPTADTDSWGFAILSRTIRQIFPDVLVAPNLVLGATDARWFGPLTQDVYRFAPFQAGPGDLARAHGTNERLAVADLPGAVAFYAQLVRNATGPPS